MTIFEGAKARKGIAIPMIVVIILLLVVSVFSLNYVSRNLTQWTHNYYLGEEAFNLADAALKETLAGLRSGDPSVAELKSFIDALKSGNVNLDQAMEARVIFSKNERDPQGRVKLSDLLKSLMYRVEEEKARVDEFSVIYRLDDVRPIVEGQEHEGIRLDPREKLGVLKIVACARLSQGRLKVTRKVVATMDFKLLSILPPVLSKFLFFVNEPSCSREDLAQVDKAWGGAANLLKTAFDGPAADENRPLELRNLTRFRCPEAAYCNKLSLLAGRADDEFLMRQGWIYMGGARQQQGDQFLGLTLNLSYGSSSFGENFHLGFQAGNRPASSTAGTGGTCTVDSCYGLATYAFFSRAQSEDLRSFNQRVAQNLIQQFDEKGYKYELASDGDLPAQQNMRAYCTDWADPTVKGRMGWHRHTHSQNLPLPDRPVAAKPLTSVLKLFGGAEQISPTVVFGRVNRGYVRQIFIYGWLESKPGGSAPLRLARKCYPVVLKRAEVMERLRQQNNVEFKFLSKALGGDDLVEKNASGPASEPYNLSNRRILSNYCQPWSGGAGRDLRSFSVNLGGEKIPVEKLGFLDSSTSYSSDQGKELFAGDLKNLLKRGGIAALLERKKAFTVNSEDFPDVCLELRGAGLVFLNARGITKVVGSSLELPPVTDCVTRGGGILMVDGDLVLKGNVHVGNGEPLTLVSLSGNVVIEDGCTRVDAGLVAVEGTLKLPKNKIHIRGPVAVNELDMASLLGPEEKVIEYDARFDGSQAATATAALRIYWDPDFHIFVTAAGGSE